MSKHLDLSQHALNQLVNVCTETERGMAKERGGRDEQRGGWGGGGGVLKMLITIIRRRLLNAVNIFDVNAQHIHDITIPRHCSAVR